MSHFDRATFLRVVGAAALTVPASAAMAAPVRTFASRATLFDAGPVLDIPTKVSKIADLSTLSSLLTSTGLGSTLAGTGPFTLFAPTNEAFATLPSRQQNWLKNHPNILMKLLTYHVLNGNYPLAKLVPGNYATMEGKTVDVDVVNPNSVVTVNRARIVVPNVQATNGTIHIITKVLTKVITEPN
jgi:uncharacterized surface protein with fasciclin (FAS1) repeats